MNTLRRTWGAAALAAGAWIILPAWASAQEASAAPQGPPPSWDSLIPCAVKTDPAEGFACYQAAMRAAGFKPNAAVARTERHRLFGLTAPSLSVLHHPPKETGAAAAPAPAASAPAASQAAPALAAAPPPPAEVEDEDTITVRLEEVAVIPLSKRLLMVTSDGGIWKQTDNEVVSPLPRPGQTMTIRHTQFGGYFCKLDKYNSVRCTRTR